MARRTQRGQCAAIGISDYNRLPERTTSGLAIGIKAGAYTM